MSQNSNYGSNSIDEDLETLPPFLGLDNLDNDGSDLFDNDTEQIRTRHRSNTISSIVSVYELVKEHLDKKRFAYLVLASLFLYLGFVMAFAPRTSLSRDFRRAHSSKLTTAEVYRIYLSSLQVENHAETHLKNLSENGRDDNRDGLNLQYLEDQFHDLGFHPKLTKYYPWISRPLDVDVQLLRDGKSIFKATMEEDDVEYEDSSNSFTRGFHAYSCNGDVTAQYIFSNYGSLEDYKQLIENNINIEGKIHIIRHGKLLPGIKVKNAELYGASGVILYTDPYDDGEVTTANGYKSFPDGPARNPRSIERSSVEYFSESPGDPTTPGYASRYFDIERMSPAGRLPRIPSVPLSSNEVTFILKHLKKNGHRFDSKGSIEGFHYYSGPSEKGLEIRLFNKQDYAVKEVTDLEVRIPGIFTDGEIIVGSHRDTWGVGGSSGSYSGTAVLLEIARGLSELKKLGWKPLRSIKLISWDNELFAKTGSVEYAEQHTAILKRNTLAYINLDSAISGSEFSCKANPLLHDIIYKAAKFTNFKGEENWTLFDEWKKSTNATIDYVNGDAEFFAFQYNLGVASVEFSFKNNGTGDAIYHKHSSYDNLSWLKSYVDSDFQLHNTLAMFTGLTTLMIGETELLPYQTHPYLKEISERYEFWNKKLLTVFSHDRELANLASSVSNLIKLATWKDSLAFDKENYLLHLECTHDLPLWSFFKKFKLYVRLLRSNNKLKQLDRLFITNRGLKGREWFKHSIVAPDKFIGSKTCLLPGLHESLLDTDRDAVVQWLKILQSQFSNIRYLLQ
ncbi:hypothetical protein NCAS_0J02130 [Naumovozyma castellii]|uniref:Uncharacterized protein n=1 Tax=Naumovozyma castellii TaxID=27288 RepID=G0VL03_NAUCA|nr:hypothetical protein NCAS_0J02130 [Naumovozyma castellii CBS 4309]CCC72192.1 hypothetical protein NCAS_0J02130 [Naumovozyma castellii CBS 4309]